MKRIFTYILLCLLLTAATSCRDLFENITNPDHVMDIPEDEEYWSNVFEIFWQGMDQNYNFWDCDTTDWDMIHRIYSPKFKALGADADSATVVGLFKEITRGLIDNHYSFKLPQIQFAYNPSNDKLKKRSYYHEYDPYFYEYLINAILKPRKPEMENTSFLFLPGSNVLGINYIYKNIAFLHFNSFGFSDQSDPEDDKNVMKFVDNYHKIVQSDKVKALVIDLRHNTGGMTDDLTLFFSDLIRQDESQVFGYTRYKNGPGRLDYTPLIESKIDGTGKATQNEKPVVVLADLYTASCGENSVWFIKSFFKDVTFIGERTMGAQGILIESSCYSGGMFKNDYMDVYTPSCAFLYTDKKCYEGYGITPDIEILYDPDAFHQGKDRQLDAAIHHLQEKIN